MAIRAPALQGPRRQRDLVLALIIARLLDPAAKLATARMLDPATASLTIVVNPALSVTTTSLSAGVIGTVYPGAALAAGPAGHAGARS